MRHVWTRALLGAVIVMSTIPGMGAAADHEPHRLGEWPHAVLLCKFADRPEEPHPVPHYEAVLSDAFPGASHYWRDVSYGRFSISGTRVFGWFQLPGTYADYVPDPDVRETTNYLRLAEDCSRAAQSHGVDLTQYKGTIYWVNAYIGATGSGGKVYIGDDSRIHGVVAHEMGHSFGFRHTSGSPGAEYGSGWDLMSNMSPTCTSDTCIPVHPIAEWKRRAGWITDDEVFRAKAGTITTLWLDPLTAPSLGAGHLRMARVPIRGDNDHYYTLEARSPSGYDAPLPASAVVLHKFDMEGYPQWQAPDEVRLLIDADKDGDAMDDGAMWHPGETFLDKKHGIKVSVLAHNSEGAFKVRVVSPAPAQRSHARTISLKLDRRAESGIVHLVIEHDPELCPERMPVRIQRKTRAGWNTVDKQAIYAGRSEISMYPAWAKKGWYRLVAPRVETRWEICERAVSNRAWYAR